MGKITFPILGGLYGYREQGVVIAAPFFVTLRMQVKENLF
jgi:hypothetical protein